ncbi:PREDICTED: uncharacterized protein LOC105563106 [Vollenhovia emeryi]|uniref:uncharacterized protein LOC105563106 n=1 Tax=Vollenhovia emeryi TaxID=411798 RepID=UPI0005F47F4B|nr:PREDICTED: uncharacterized protein LOC105563106 [Vollenhovia emeryi]
MTSEHHGQRCGEEVSASATDRPPRSRSWKIRRGEEEKERRGSKLQSSNWRSPSLFCRRSDRSTHQPRWSHHSDGPGKGSSSSSSNQGQSGHQSWHQPVDGTAREDQNQRVQPESGVRRKPAIRRGAKTSNRNG